jgi:hypothetical protein
MLRYPLPDDVTRKCTYDIVDQIRCEARRAVIEHAYDYKTASIAYEFTFDITEGNNTSADATWILPYAPRWKLSARSQCWHESHARNEA